MKKFALSVCVLVLSYASGFASVVEPSVEITESANVDGLLEVVNGDSQEFEQSNVLKVRKFSAGKLGVGTHWVPLGSFKWGTAHRLTVNSNGGWASSSGVVEFGVAYNQGRVTATRLDQFHGRNSFELFSYRRGAWTSLVLKYSTWAPKGRNAVNEVSVVHSALGKHNPTNGEVWVRWDREVLQNQFLGLSEAEKENRRVRADVEIHTLSPNEELTDVQRGMRVNAPISFSQAVEIAGLEPITAGTGTQSLSQGVSSSASGWGAFSMGARTKALGNHSFVFGKESEATKEFSVALGYKNKVRGWAAFAQGLENVVEGSRSFAFGRRNLIHSSAQNAGAFGYANQVNANHGMAFGNANLIGNAKNPESNEGHNSVAFGVRNKAHREWSFVGGYGSESHYVGDFAFGRGAIANSSREMDKGEDHHSAVAFGIGTQSLGASSFAAGHKAKALSRGSVAMGWDVESNGTTAASFGRGSKASNFASFAAGDNTQAMRSWSASFGGYTVANKRGQFVVGHHNTTEGSVNDAVRGHDHLFVVGNGANQENRSNAFVVRRNGNVEVNGSLRILKPSGDISMGDFQ